MGLAARFPAPPGTYPGKDAVADYLRGYADAAGLNCEVNARVLGLGRSGAGFVVRTADRTYVADQVVVATGPFQIPLVAPAAEGLDVLGGAIASAKIFMPG